LSKKFSVVFILEKTSANHFGQELETGVGRGPLFLSPEIELRRGKTPRLAADYRSACQKDVATTLILSHPPLDAAEERKKKRIFV
jgi:hypothetical protein